MHNPFQNSLYRLAYNRLARKKYAQFRVSYNHVKKISIIFYHITK